MLNSISKGGSKTKETPKSTDLIGREQNFGSKEFRLGHGPRYESMRWCYCGITFPLNISSPNLRNLSSSFEKSTLHLEINIGSQIKVH